MTLPKNHRGQYTQKEMELMLDNFGFSNKVRYSLLRYFVDGVRYKDLPFKKQTIYRKVRKVVDWIDKWVR